MNDRSHPPAFLRVIGLEAPGEPVSLSCHGRTPKGESLMFLLHVCTFLGFLLLLLHLISFLLTKLFTFLLEGAATSGDQRSSQPIAEAEIKPTSDACYSDDEELAADIFGGEEGLLFFYNESIFDDTLLVEEEKDSSDQEHLLRVDESFVTESLHGSPLEDQSNPGLENDDSPVSDVIRTSSSPPIICGSVKDEDCVGDAFHNNEKEEEEQNEESSKKQKLLIVAQTHPESKKFQLEERTSGGSLTSESTSKSSMEWRSSTNLRDSETECPFSSSSRRSSSNWETYTWFRKYDEDMTFFDRISAQKLTETESFRSMKYQPESVSRRIVHKFTTQKKKKKKKKKGNRDPYQELESAYVAHICLAWEALNWNYNHFRQWSAKGSNSERASCTAWMAQQFQQFQVLLQRFIENEPYERGRRPQVFGRTRISSPKLLLVPEFRDSEADEGKEEMISSTEFSGILEDAIRTFMDFLKADKENPCQMLKAFIKRKSSSVDPNLLRLLKRANKKKKMRLKDLLTPRRCLKKKRLKGEEEVAILMGLIDMKIVSRTLRMHEISREQLHWCEEKMAKVRVCDGKIQRDSSPLFFPLQ
ncbi:hypothetical protein OPV22_034896 [Ensete ventricosum]|uniref:Uncharacterized protein n=1 Tax=Ensete ventricosum TaxID=4639 RepID=A0AAV8NYQ7_ENSVE|nr:hypothetical protein OPV22_034896 [Ensete ventricosum]